MDLGVTFTKYVVFFFNFLFAIIGIGMIATGFVVRTHFLDYHKIIEYDLTPYPIFLIVVGCTVFLIAFLGCCGAIKENTCMLLLYSIILIVIVVLEVGLVYAAFSKKGELQEIVQKGLTDALHKSKTDNAYLKSWDSLQSELHCCGVTNKNDWTGVFPDNTLPGSCCGKQITDKCTLEESTDTGCKSAFLEYLNSNMSTVAIFAIIVAFVQILAIVFSCCLHSVYRRDAYTY